MVVFGIGLLCAFMGSWATSQKRNPRAKPSDGTSLASALYLWREPGWSLEKKLVFGGLAASVGSLLICFIVLLVFGTRS